MRLSDSQCGPLGWSTTPRSRHSRGTVEDWIGRAGGTIHGASGAGPYLSFDGVDDCNPASGNWTWMLAFRTPSPTANFSIFSQAGLDGSGVSAAMRILYCIALALLLCGLVGAQFLTTTTIVPPPTAGGIPTPAFQWDYDDGSGTTITGQVGGQDCELDFSNQNGWVTDPVAHDYDEGRADCGVILDNFTVGTVAACVDLDTDGQFDAGRYFAKVGGVGDIDWIFGSGVNKHRLIFANTSAENEVFSIADTYPTGWVHVVFTFNCPDLDTCVAQGYIDGSPVTTTQDTDFTGARRADSDYEFFHGDQVTDTVAMDGRMRLPKIWTLQLNDTQVAALAAQDVCDP